MNYKKYGAVALLLSGAIAARADVLVNTFAGSGAGFFPTVGWNVDSSLFMGKTFTVSGNYTLSQIDIALRITNDEDQMFVNLHSDSGGVPGAVLESFTVSNTLGAGVGGIYTMSSVSNPLMTSGTYYVTVEPIGNATGKWLLNRGGVTGAMVTSSDGGGSWTNFTDTNGAVTVQGTPAVPEPASLTALGLGAMALIRRRKRS